MTPTLEQLRARIDELDTQILELLRARQDVSRSAGALKAAQGLPIVQPEREQQLYRARREQAGRLGLEAGYVETLWRIIHQESCRQQALIAGLTPLPDELETERTGPAG